jgi:hypothetical protein
MSHALGSKDLTATYERLFPNIKTAVMRLVYVALQLDHYDRFPDSLVRDQAKELRHNAFGIRVLRNLVVRYLAIFPTDFRLKQRLSEP